MLQLSSEPAARRFGSGPSRSKPVDRREPIRGALSGVPGAAPRCVSSSSSSAISGISRYASRSSSWTPPAVTVVSKPRSSTVAPTISLPSARGHQIHPLAGDDSPQTGSSAAAQGQDLSLHRPHRRPRLRREPLGPPDQQPAARTNSRALKLRPSAVSTRQAPSRRSAATPRRRHGPRRSAALEGAEQRREHGRDRRWPRRERARRRGQRWRGPARASGRPGRAASRSRGRARDGACSAGAAPRPRRGRARRAARRERRSRSPSPTPSSSCAKPGQPAQGRQVQLEQLLLAPGRLACRREHPGRDASRARGRALALEHADARASRAARQAQASPITPPPTKIAS